MFKKADMEAYRSVKAPLELREKVLMADRRRSFSYYKMQAVPACMVAVMGLAMMWNWNHSYVTIQGDMTSMVQTETFASLDSRKVSQNSISVKLNSNHKRNVTVSEGTLQYVDPESGEITVRDKDLKVGSNAEILWIIDPQTEECYELNVSGWGKDETFLLIYNQEDENWELKQK